MYKNPANNESHLMYLGHYHAYWLDKSRRIVNPGYDAHSKEIYYLKELHATAIIKFYNQINELILDDDIAICYVPSHDSEKTDSGIRRLAIRLTKDSKRVDATMCLVRHTTIQKLAYGGDRSITVHLESIKVVNKSLIKGKKVLVLDDVTTSNNSLLACAELLTGVCAMDVYCLALGQTI